MQLRDALLGVTRDARGWLKTWAGDFTQEEAKRTGGSRVNPIAWQLGHIASAQDDVYCLFTGDTSVVPTAVRTVCGTGCPKPTRSTRYPPIADLWALLDRTQERLIRLIELSEDANFDQPPLRENPYFTARGQAVYEIALHENYHVGAIAALRAALGKASIG